MIEDQELRELFKVESEEHLQSLDAGLLHLEKHPGDADTLEALFRNAHSLKGAARMLGVADVETLAHRFEDLLGAGSKGVIAITPALIDRLIAGLDTIRALVLEAVTGTPAQVSISRALDRLSDSPPLATDPEAGAEKGPTTPAPMAAKVPPPAADATPEPDPKQAPAPPPQETGTEENSAPSSSALIRVAPRKLDLLLDKLGELSVVQTRFTQRLGEIEQNIHLWEACARQMHAGSNLAAPWTEMPEWEQLGQRLHQLRQEILVDRTGLDLATQALEEGIRNLRLLPLSTLFDLFPRLVRDLSRQQNKLISLVTEGGETTADKRIIEELKSAFTHLINNAVDHGLESSQERLAVGKPAEGTLRITASRTPSHVVIQFADDGRGLDLAVIKAQARRRGTVSETVLEAMSDPQLSALIFQSGFSTSTRVTGVSGRGVGLDAVRNSVEALKGTIQVSSKPGRGSLFIIRLPITLTTIPVFVVAASGQQYAVPLDFVHSVRHVGPPDIFLIEGNKTIEVGGNPVSVANLTELLELPELPDPPPPPWPCVILTTGEERLGILVDDLLDELDVVLKPHGGILERVRNFSGATLLGTGAVCMVINPQDLIQTVQKRGINTPPREQPGDQQQKKWLLLAEDSITTRTQEKRILEGAGYDVVTAVDGADALNKLGSQPFDGLISDIQMPNLDGLSLTEKIRKNPVYRELPIILVTSLNSEQDMRRGLEVGANAYITKPAFDQRIFLETVRRLV